MIKLKFTDFVKHMNKDMIPKFEEDEKTIFKTHREVYNHIASTYGTSMFDNVEMFEDEKKLSYWSLSIHRKPYTKPKFKS